MEQSPPSAVSRLTPLPQLRKMQHNLSIPVADEIRRCRPCRFVRLLVSVADRTVLDTQYLNATATAGECRAFAYLRRCVTSKHLVETDCPTFSCRRHANYRCRPALMHHEVELSADAGLASHGD